MAKLSTILIAILLIGAAVALAAEIAPTSSASWRYKMTIEVETPEGLKTGSAVREVTVRRTNPIAPEVAGFQAKVRGEAVMVDLGKQGKVFALLQSAIGPDYAYQVVFDAFPFNGAVTPAGLEYYSHLKNARIVLKPEDYPTIVTFADLNDPKSVEPVWVGEFYDKRQGAGAVRAFRVRTDDFQKLFGQGVYLKDVKIEMTDNDINKGLNNTIKWLPYYYNKRLDGLRYNTIVFKNPFANSLSSGSLSSKDALNHGR